MASRRIVKLNVGGVYYTTSRDTLTCQVGSLFDDILSGPLGCPRDERGNYFIDRDGHIFRFILNFLRTSKLTLPHGYRELPLLKEEATYFNLSKLVQQIENLERHRRRNFRGRRKKSFHSSLETLHFDDPPFNGDGYFDN